MGIRRRAISLTAIWLLAIVACTPRAPGAPLVVTVTATHESTATVPPTSTPTETPEPTSTRVPPCEPSGVAWVTRFPTSQSTDDLTPAFRGKVNRFIAALNAANASIKVSETYRSPERAYLMHYAYRIARDKLDPASVPAMKDVNICWLRRNADGSPDLVATKQAAEEMVKAYNIAFRPAIDSDHIDRRAIDMTIAWQGNLRIVDGTGKVVIINTEPRNGTNAELRKVGATYGVIKLVVDPPHWSDEGK